MTVVYFGLFWNMVDVLNRASKFSYIQIYDAHSHVVYSRAYAREDDNLRRCITWSLQCLEIQASSDKDKY